MTATIKSEVSREVYSNFSVTAVTFRVHNPNGRFAALGERHSWDLIGSISDYSHSGKLIVTPCILPNGVEYPQTWVDSLAEGMRFMTAHAETFLAISAIESEREEWFGVMAEAEAAEARARAILTDSPAVPPF